MFGLSLNIGIMRFVLEWKYMVVMVCILMEFLFFRLELDINDMYSEYISVCL